jgi:putative intracellular protease/amidase
MPALDLKVETRIGVKRKPRRILSIVSNTAQLKGFPVGFFGEEMTRAFLMFTEAGHQVDLASPKGGEVMIDTHSDPRTPGGRRPTNPMSIAGIAQPPAVKIRMATKPPMKSTMPPTADSRSHHQDAPAKKSNDAPITVNAGKLGHEPPPKKPPELICPSIPPPRSSSTFVSPGASPA